VTKSARQNYSVEISIDYSIERIRAIWNQIESNTKIPFFRSWKWIGCWIETYNPKLVVAVVSYENKPVAIGLFVKQMEVRRKIIRSTLLRLHQTGIPAEDQIWIEYNGLIALPEHEVFATTLCLNTLFENLPEIDEIHISMINLELWNLIQLDTNYQFQFTSESSASYGINLSPLTDVDTYLESLKSNTRAQIRRAIRLYEKSHGPLVFEPAVNLTQALQFFEELSILHKSRWSDSGFKNPSFINFHTRLIENNFAENSANIFRLRAGNQTIAGLYFFMDGNSAYFYLQGVSYEANGKYKPGLVAHTFAIDHFIRKGYDYYDFMGGESQYKKQLAIQSSLMSGIKIQRPKFLFALENNARALKEKLFGFAKNTSGNKNLLRRRLSTGNTRNSLNSYPL
jgi:hypothetical protein